MTIVRPLVLPPIDRPMVPVMGGSALPWEPGLPPPSYDVLIRNRITVDGHNRITVGGNLRITVE